MTDKTLEIAPDCKLTYYTYGDPVLQSDVSLEYVEHSTDHWHSDMDTEICITKEMAVDIIAFLTEAFGL